MDTAAFVEFLVRADVVTFGDFVTRSGRPTPYFLDFGRIRTAHQLDVLGRAYADAVVGTFGDDLDVLFGPAYKGIPLAVATALALHRHHGVEVAVCFDRKEVKDHGEGGRLVGHRPRDGDRVVVVEDVTTAGTSVRDTVPLLRSAADVDLRGLVVAVDRRERTGPDPDAPSALAALGAEFGMRTVAITDIDTIVGYLRDHDVDDLRIIGPDDLERIAAYRATYGA